MKNFKSLVIMVFIFLSSCMSSIKSTENVERQLAETPQNKRQLSTIESKYLVETLEKLDSSYVERAMHGIYNVNIPKIKCSRQTNTKYYERSNQDCFIYSDVKNNKFTVVSNEELNGSKISNEQKQAVNDLRFIVRNLKPESKASIQKLDKEAYFKETEIKNLQCRGIENNSSEDNLNFETNYNCSIDKK